MQALIDAKLVTVRRENMWLEIEINTDILFPSGSGAFAAQAEPVLDKLGEVLKPFPNPIRVEGHTDDRPIRTSAFPSNWELSAARAASVVHQFTKQGIDPLRLEIVGFGEFHPRQPNDSADGRNANRRVAILVLEQVAPGAAIRYRQGGAGQGSSRARREGGAQRTGGPASWTGGAGLAGRKGGRKGACARARIGEVRHERNRSLEQFRPISGASDCGPTSQQRRIARQASVRCPLRQSRSESGRRFTRSGRTAPPEIHHRRIRLNQVPLTTQRPGCAIRLTNLRSGRLIGKATSTSVQVTLFS